MRFHFPLEGLLHVRLLLERQAREGLDASMMHIAALDRSLVEARQWSENTARVLSSKKRLPAIELQFVHSVLQQAREAISRCEQQKHHEEQRAAELRAAYLLARRERKTVSTLRENAHRQFKIEQARREQFEMDEAFLGKLLHHRNSAREVSVNANAEDGF
jgi:flagellar export protein FliJ